MDKKGKPNWKKFVQSVILEVYGDGIGKFSVYGKRGTEHPGVDSHLFETVYSKFDENTQVFIKIFSN